MNLTHITPTHSLARRAASLYDLHTIALSLLLYGKWINRCCLHINNPCILGQNCFTRKYLKHYEINCRF